MNAWSGIDEFVAVASAGSFKGGAASFGASTTHMSRSIARLEARLQAQLFQRTTRVVRLTDTGRAFLGHCQRIILERDNAIASINELGEPQGELRVTCSTAMGERFVAPIIRQFAAQFPKLSVTIELTNRVVDLVAEGFDLAVRTGTLADSRLIATRIASRSLHACASSTYLKTHGTPTSVVDLERHDCLVGTSGTWHFRSGGKDVIHRPVTRWKCNSGAAVAEAALSGMGICQLPEFYVLPHIADGRLVPVLEHCRPLDEPIWAVYPERRHLLPKISGLVQRLRAELPLALKRTGATILQC